MISFDTFVKIIEVVALVVLFSGLIAVAIVTMLGGVSQAYQEGRHLRATPDPPRVRKLPFDQDANA